MGSIIKACFRKSPIDPEVDYEYFADRCEGFSGADISGVCKAAAKSAIRGCITQERKKFERREAKKAEAAEKGEEYVSDDEREREREKKKKKNKREQEYLTAYTYNQKAA